jgi:hypothetical protein
MLKDVTQKIGRRMPNFSGMPVEDTMTTDNTAAVTLLKAPMTAHRTTGLSIG